MKISQTGQRFYVRSLLSFLSHRSTWSSSLITLSRPSLTSCLKIANISLSFYHSARLSLISQPLFFLRSWKPVSFTLPFLDLSLYSPKLSQNLYFRYRPSFVVSSHTHFAIIHRHFIHATLYFIWLLSVFEYVVINCFNYLGTINHLHFTLLFVFTSSRYGIIY